MHELYRLLFSCAFASIQVMAEAKGQKRDLTQLGFRGLGFSRLLFSGIPHPAQMEIKG